MEVLPPGGRPYNFFPMRRYSRFIDGLFARPDFLQELQPKEPLFWKLSDEFRSLSESDLAGGKPVMDSQQFALVRGGVLYALDELDAAHRIFQDDASSEGSYWHGMMHRREGDFDNARYWFRRAGRMAVFSEIHDAARGISESMGRQENWDPYLFTGLCEQARFGAQELVPECQRLQRAEFEALFHRAWSKAVGPGGG
jgi:hypothetical protein